jgi:Fic-DOC domain mobile mystery protein B
MGLTQEYAPGQTPINEDESDGLKILTITTQGELNEFEQHNIEHAMLWLKSQKPTAQQLLSENFIKKLHTKMYGDVWKWAGKFRKSEKNLGIQYHLIETELKKLMDDTLYWIAHSTYSPDEIAIRFKHRLVSIHCFPNGNGRHSRIMADLIVEKIFGLPHFNWGKSTLTENDGVRDAYLKALREADHFNYQPLILFARGNH